MSDSDDRRLAGESLRDRFIALLETDDREQTYQRYLEENTQLIPREFIQNHGLHFALVLRKLRFGGDYVTDFFYMSKSSDDWNLIFIEIEKPSSRYFGDNSTEFHRDFRKALEQIGQWRAWLSNPDNLASLLSNSLAPIHIPEVMRRNPVHPKFVLVHGRRSEYAGNSARRALIHAQERDDFKIMSFDSLAEDLAHKHECYIGIRYNDRIHIRGNSVIAPDLWGWIEPTQFSVGKELQTLLKAGQKNGPWVRRFGGGKMVNAFEYVGEHILIRRDDSDAVD